MRCTMWNVKCVMRKSGVSLITVLLFMLVATIAATATYKWITSEGHSSASRMMQREAYQSSVAGLENARTWMTFHANDVGDLIHQFVAGGYKPINIDGRLRTLQRQGQNYHVWLTGVNTKASTYKVKLVSYGESRNNTRHAEAAIFNVDGLYRIKTPRIKVESNINFNEAFFGGLTSAGNIYVNSAIVNGNIDPRNAGGTASTDVQVSDYLVVTGSAEFNSSTNIGGDFYIGGQLSLCTNMSVGGNFITPNILYAPMGGKGLSITGDANVGGIDLTQRSPNNMGGCSGSAGGDLTIGKNLTSSGHIKTKITSGDGYKFSVGENLVMTGGYFRMGYTPNNQEITPAVSGWGYIQYQADLDVKVGGNVYMKNGIQGTHIDYKKSGDVQFGNATATVYIPNAYQISNPSVWNRGTGVNYTTNDVPSNTYCTYASGSCNLSRSWDFGNTNYPYGALFSILRQSGAMPSQAQIDSWKANDGSAYTSKITTGGTSIGCTTDKYVNDPIQLNKSILNTSYVHTATAPGSCSDALWKTSTSDYSDFAAALNACYSLAADNHELYNDEWLVVRITAPTSGETWQGGESKIAHNIFLIVDIDEGGSQPNYFYLPETQNDSYMMLYLPDGWAGTLGFNSETGKYNYFIFSEGNITDFQMNDEDHKMDGSIFMSKCAKMNTNTHNSTVSARYSQTLMNALGGAAILCNYNNANPNACSLGGAADEEEDDELLEGGYDAYYISMAPQLGVSLETQYETNETFATGDNDVTPLDPAFIVLPRVIYLPTDPYGKLSDYYNVLPLNGSSLKKTDVEITGCGALSGTPLVSGGAKLTKGALYTCVAKAANHEDVPFWVLIGDDQRTTPSVYFVEASQQMPKTTATGTAYVVHAHIPPHDNDITVQVTCPNLGTETSTSSEDTYWKYTLQSGGSKAGTTCSFVFSSAVEGDMPLFSVTTTNAPNGTLTFHLQAGEGYQLASPYSAELHVSSTATLNRGEVNDSDLDEFCKNGNTECPANYKDYWPTFNCGTGNGIWVEPTGVSFGTPIPNDRWSIAVGGLGTLSLTSRYSGDDCVVIIPADSRPVADIEAETTINPDMRASIKAKKKTLRVGFTGDVGNGKNPTIKVHNDSRNVDLDDCIHGNISGANPKYCSYDVFVGEQISFSVDEDASNNDINFNYWKCESDNCASREPLPNTSYGTITISGSIDYLAHFGESDKHCFFEEFKEGSGYNYSRTNRSTLTCSGTAEYCIDNCGGTCTTAANGTRKWRLLKGTMTDLDYSSTDGHLSIKSSVNKGQRASDKSNIVVMSTANAGMDGTMKALVQIPRASDYGKNSMNILGSGIILRSNATATEYLTLNVYANALNNLEAQVCKFTQNGSPDEYSGCVSEELLTTNSAKASVTISSMVMVSAQVDDGNLIVSAFTSHYYGSPTAYTHTFDISGMGLNDREHEYVGFSIADNNFKIHGIGWHSEDYNSDCFDTYPTVKCSFAAVSKGGIIETGEPVVPWVGYSGWFNSASCTEQYFYYNGPDACGGSTNGEKAECPNSGTNRGYTFSANTSGNTDNEGAHGFKDANGNDVKTAKAWLNCSTSSDGKLADTWWTQASEGEYAHCGYFWTGKYSECANDATLATDVNVNAGSSPTTISLGNTPVNLRGVTLTIEVSGTNDGGLELWLETDNNGTGCWGSCEPFMSQSVLLQGSSGSYDVAQIFVGDSTGFNPEKVNRIMIRNHGTSAVSVTISSDCANSISINQCSATYDDGTGLWTITVQVENRDNVDVTEYKATVNTTTQFGYAETSTNCQKSGTESDVIVCQQADNPYLIVQGSTNQGKQYVFSAKISGNSGNSTDEKECSSTAAIGTVSRTCNVDANSVLQGHGLPKFNATITCPKSTGCGYKVKFGETVLLDEKNTLTDGNPTNVAQNGNTSPVYTTGTYSYTLESTDGLFEPCVAEFEVTEPGDISASCTFNTVAPGGTASLSMTNIQNVENATNFTISCSNCPTGYQFTPSITSLSAGATSATPTFTAPAVKGNDYQYSVTYNKNGTTKNICSAKLSVVDGLTCTVSPASITLGESFTFSPSWGGSCISTTLSGSGVSNPSDCQTSYTITPTALGDQTYSYSFTGALGSGLHCPAALTVTVNPPAPSFDCPQNWSGTVGSNVKFEPRNLNYCSSTYPCELKIDGDTKSSNWTGPDYTWSSGATTSTTKHTISLKNAHNNDATVKDCDITYTTTSSTYRADCWWKDKDNTKTLTTFPINNQYNHFYIKSISGFSSNNTPGTFTFNNQTSSIMIDQNGSTRQKDNILMPSTPGTYPYYVSYNGEKVCEGNLTVAAPITCSVSPSAITGSTSVTFSALIDTALNNAFGMQLHDCGFKKDGNWKDNDQNPHGSADGNTDSWITTISTGATFTYECKQGQISDRTCSKSVVLQAPPEITNCTALTSTQKTGDPVSISPAASNCAGNCAYYITGDATVTHSTKDWSSGDAITLPTVNDDVDKTYTLKIENDYGDDECKDFVITYSSAAPSCNASNSSTELVNMTVEADKCYWFRTASGNLKVGNWSGAGRSMTYVDCSGTEYTVTVPNGDWSTYSVGSAGCTSYVKFAESAYLQFGSY